ILVELMRKLLLDAVVAVQVEAVAIFALQIGIGRLLAKAIERGREMPMKDGERIPGLWMRGKSLREQHVRAEKHRPPPELRQAFALNADVLDVLRLGRVGNRWDHRVEG